MGGDKMPKPGLLGFLVVIIAAANVITAIAALIVAVQVWNLDISGGGSMSVNINGSVPVHNDQQRGRNIPWETAAVMGVTKT
jgi:hypothetical protein